MKNDSGKLSKKIKKMDFGQYLFLYFVARNTPWRVSNDIMQALKRVDGKFIKTEKTLLEAPKEDDETSSQISGPPPYTTYANPRKNANKIKEERIDMPDSGSNKDRPYLEESCEKESSEKSLKNRKTKSQSSGLTQDDQNAYLSHCLNDMK